MEEEMLLNRGRPPEVAVRSLEVRVSEFEDLSQRCGEVWDTRRLKKETAMARAAYKRKDKKVKPVDVALPDGVSPEGGTFAPKETGEKHAGKTVPRGAD